MIRISMVVLALTAACSGDKSDDPSTGDTGRTPADTDTDTDTDIDTDTDTDTDTDSDTDTDTDTDTDSDTDTDTDTDTDVDTADSADTGTLAPGIAIAGVYADPYGTTVTITDTAWTLSFGAYGDSVHHITQFDNTQQFAVASNDAANSYFPGDWSRFDWAEYKGELYFCQSAYNAPDEATALATPRADDRDPTRNGCGSFAWTLLTP